MNKQTVHVNGIDMVYEECGMGNEKTIVLLHGFCGSSHYWHNVCPLLSDKYHLIMPQLRGHGESSAPEGVYTMETMAEDISELLDKLRIDKAVMLGHSLGGYITLAFAEKYADRLSGFGLIHSTAFPDTEETIRRRLQDIDAIREAGIAAYVTGLVPKLFADSKQDKLRDEMERAIAIGKLMKPEGAIRTLEGMILRPDRSSILSNAPYPILLIAGEEDEVIPPEATFSLSGNDAAESTYRYPHISENTFEGVAHMSVFEVPDQLSRVIAAYVKTVHEKEVKRVN